MVDEVSRKALLESSGTRAAELAIFSREAATE